MYCRFSSIECFVSHWKRLSPDTIGERSSEPGLRRTRYLEYRAIHSSRILIAYSFLDMFLSCDEHMDSVWQSIASRLVDPLACPEASFGGSSRHETFWNYA